MSCFFLLHMYFTAFYFCLLKRGKWMSYFNFIDSAVPKLLTAFSLLDLTTKRDGTVTIADGKLSHATH